MDTRKGALSKGAIPKATRSTTPFGRSTKTQRSPPTATITFGNADESMYQCDVCAITDKGDKVCCDSCNLWSHFACVNVTSDIANHDWFCGKCQLKRQKPPVDVTAETGTAATNNSAASNQETTGNVTNMQSSPADVANPALVHPSQSVVPEQSEILNVSSTSQVSQPKSNRSHKSDPLRSSTSSSNRKNSLA